MGGWDGVDCAVSRNKQRSAGAKNHFFNFEICKQYQSVTTKIQIRRAEGYNYESEG
jgi:hypothetical protein